MPTVGTTSKPAYVYDAGTDTWIPIGVGAHTHDYIDKSVITTTGDIIYASAANTPARLGIGSADQVLKVSGGVPTWATLASGSTFSGCSLYRTGSSQTYNSNTQVIVTFNNEDYDTDGYHSNVTNPSRITIPSGKAGKYLFYYRGFLTSYSSSNYINVGFWVNGTDTLFNVNHPAGSWSEAFHEGWFFANLNVGDYVEVDVNQASGSSKTARTDSYYYQRFYCTYLGA